MAGEAARALAKAVAAATERIGAAVLLAEGAGAAALFRGGVGVVGRGEREK